MSDGNGHNAERFDGKGHVEVAKPSTLLDIGDVEDELSDLVDKKSGGEIGDAEFKAALFRLLDIKHARSVAAIQDQDRQRSRHSSLHRQKSWAAGTTEATKADRRARAKAARATAANAAAAAAAASTNQGSSRSSIRPLFKDDRHGTTPTKRTRGGLSSSSGLPSGRGGLPLLPAEGAP